MLKVPHMCGGSNDFANLMFVQTRPWARRFEGLLVMQTNYELPTPRHVKRIFLALYDGEIYAPADSLGGGGGGKSTALSATALAAARGANAK
jgi:hypothetical protein